VLQLTSYTRRGNNPNEAYGKLNQMEVNLEQLTPTTPFSATAEIYSLTYDLSSPATNYETYTLVNTTTLSFTYENFLSLPAVKMAFSVKRSLIVSLILIITSFFGSSYDFYQIFKTEVQTTTHWCIHTKTLNLM